MSLHNLLDQAPISEGQQVRSTLPLDASCYVESMWSLYEHVCTVCSVPLTDMLAAMHVNKVSVNCNQNHSVTPAVHSLVAR